MQHRRAGVFLFEPEFLAVRSVIGSHSNGSSVKCHEQHDRPRREHRIFGIRARCQNVSESSCQEFLARCRSQATTRGSPGDSHPP